ncbi:MAG: oxidoreductase [Motiliproteus sp.]
MTRLNKSDLALFKGLKSLSESAFPKACNFCNRRYESAEDFVKATQELPQGSGLKASWDDDDHSIVELYRNCVCGSTLMDFFSDRRDGSDRGLSRREHFGKMLNILTTRGIEADLARHELITVMRGGRSATLEAMGLKFRD